MSDTVDRLQQARQAIIESIDDTLLVVQGADHFRESVEQLLVGTPYEKPAGYDFLGLYGRLHDALAQVHRNNSVDTTPTSV